MTPKIKRALETIRDEYRKHEISEGVMPDDYCSRAIRRRIPMAIKIIKPGKKPDTTERFECSYCGCMFEADEDDYEFEFDSLNGCYCYAADCPTCGLTARKPDDE